MENHDQAYYLNEARLRRVLEKAGPYLRRASNLQVSSEIRINTREIAHLEDKLDLTGRNLAEIQAALATLEPQVAESGEKVSLLQTEWSAVNKEVTLLEGLEKSIEGQMRQLERSKQDAQASREYIRQAIIKAETLEGQRNALREKAQSLRTALSETNVGLRKLEDSLPAIRKTRDLLVGLIPSGFEPDVYQSLQDDVGPKITRYLDDVNKQINHIQSQVASLKERDAATAALEQELLLKRTRIHQKIVAFQAQTQSGATMESLKKDLQDLEDQGRRLDQDYKAGQAEIEKLEESSTRLKKTIIESQTAHDQLVKKHSALVILRQEMEERGDLDEELARLGTLIQKHNLLAQANTVMADQVGNLVEELRINNYRLQTTIDDNRKVKLDLEQQLAKEFG
ncbi:MAG: hypothetical protein HQK55_02985 [Deltaproteobacteria bacterium]|nr:hypothetical protein [Deltaproteobacteria bacterium]